MRRKQTTARPPCSPLQLPTVHEVSVGGFIREPIRQHVCPDPLLGLVGTPLQLPQVLPQYGILQPRLKDGARPVGAGYVASREGVGHLGGRGREGRRVGKSGGRER